MKPGNSATKKEKQTKCYFDAKKEVSFITAQFTIIYTIQAQLCNFINIINYNNGLLDC